MVSPQIGISEMWVEIEKMHGCKRVHDKAV